MELILYEVEFFQLSVADDGSGWVAGIVEFGLNDQSFGGGGISDQIDDDLMADLRFSAPVLSNMAEHAMFYFIPFAGAGRKV